MMRSLTKKDLSIYTLEADETCCEWLYKRGWFYLMCPAYYIFKDEPVISEK